MKKIIPVILFLLTVKTTFTQNFETGLKFNDKEYKNVPLKARLTNSLYSNMPETYSLKQYAPVPKNQGEHGTCTGWATAYAGMTISESIQQNRKNKELTTENALSPGFVYKQIKNSSDTWCRLGASLKDAFEILKTKGVCKYNDINPINCPQFISPAIFSKAEKHKIKDYAKLFNISDPKTFKINAVKKSISQNHPVIIGMNTPESFEKAKDIWIPEENPAETYNGHALCIVGYDDNKYQGSFEVINSWGTQWGNNGFTRISYDTFNNFVKYAYEIISLETITENKNFSPSGNIQIIKADSSENNIKFIDGIYRLTEPRESKTPVRIIISSYCPAFVYAFTSDETKKTFTVFPPNEKISPALNYEINKIAIPDENRYIKINNGENKNYLCILFSQQKLNIEKIKNETENTYGSFKDRIYYVLKDKIIQPENIEFNQQKINFNVKNSEKNIAAIIIEIEYTD
ncbi:MAG: C1 family peptidase [Chlorobi bacterium]|nr:C1 family peptidase [Chlorobiota bacterium]